MTLLAVACDDHLSPVLLTTATDPGAGPIDVRVVELVEPQSDVLCVCEGPATWQVHSREEADR